MSELVDIEGYGDTKVHTEGPYVILTLEDVDKGFDPSRARIQFDLEESRAVRKALKRAEKRLVAEGWNE